MSKFNGFLGMPTEFVDRTHRFCNQWLARNGYRWHPLYGVWRISHEDDEGWWTGIFLAHAETIQDATDIAMADRNQREGNKG